MSAAGASASRRRVIEKGKMNAMTTRLKSIDLTPPLLGVGKKASMDELQLASEIDALHQLIYMRGGLNSTNAAIEEVAKLIYIRYSSLTEPQIYMENGIDADAVFTTPASRQDLIADLKKMFAVAQSGSELRIYRPDGTTQSLWPGDEPFRLTSSDVAGEALQLVEDIISSKSSLVDPLGTAFDAFLSGRYDHSGGLGTYLTPSSVARFMAETALAFLSPDVLHDSDEILVDPFCGTGRFLVAGYHAILESAGLELDESRNLVTRIVGADQSSSAVAKSALNMILYGAKNPRAFVVSDSIGGDELQVLSGKFPLVLTNPPFGGGKYDSKDGIAVARKYFKSLTSSKIDPALGGVARGLELLSDEGIMGIVLPDGIINGRHFTEAMRGGAFEVVASVSLPTATFALSGTVAKTSAIFMRKKTGSSSALLARAEHVGFMRKAGKAVVDPDGNDLEKILPEVLELASASYDGLAIEVRCAEPLVAVVPRDGLTTIDPSRFDAAAMDARHVISSSGGVTLGNYCKAVKKRSAARSTGENPFISILHVDAYGSIDWVEVKEYRPVTPGQLAQSNDLLVSLLNPSKLRAAVVPEKVPIVECSSEFGVFRGMEFPYAILALLHDQNVAVQLRPLGSGTSSSRRRISAQDVLDLVVPKLSDDILEELNERVKAHVSQLEEARVELARSFAVMSTE